MSVKISLSTLRKQVEDGMKKKQLAEAYGISELQMGKVLKQAGLKIRKFHVPAFELVMDEESLSKPTDFQSVDEVLPTVDVPQSEFPVNLFEEASENKVESTIFEVPFEEEASVEDNEEDNEEDPLLNELIK